MAEQPAGDIRLRQLSRILGMPIASEQEALRAVASRPAVVGEAFFHEAADSDDVTGARSALEYLEDRITFFSGLIAPGTADAVRAAFRTRLSGWESDDSDGQQSGT